MRAALSEPEALLEAIKSLVRARLGKTTEMLINHARPVEPVF